MPKIHRSKMWLHIIWCVVLIIALILSPGACGEPKAGQQPQTEQQQQQQDSTPNTSSSSERSSGSSVKGARRGLQIALHAQVAPGGKVVGSVITTDGLRAAFSRRVDVSCVEVFYPFQYTRFFEHAWDVVLIEGWFPSIDNFINMARINNKDAVVLFFMLDPRYPGLETFLKLKIDGALSNSRLMTDELQETLPTRFVMLAADPIKMRPQASPNRTHGGVFIGAGGLMVVYKYSLMALLRGAAPHGLLLYGSHWDEIAAFRDHWKGVLPRDEISIAYSRAHVVLSSTIDAQRDAGMVNNRVFEALASGAVVVSEPSQPIEELFGGIVQYARGEQQVSDLIGRVVADDTSGSMYWDNVRRSARTAVIRAHTWDHRVVEILDFAFNIMLHRGGDLRRIAPSISTIDKLIVDHPDIFPLSSIESLHGCSSQRQLPSLAWVVSDVARGMRDYSVLAPQILPILKGFYCIYYFEESSWVRLSAHYGTNFTDAFDILLVYASMFDSLDVHMSTIGRQVGDVFQRVQRRIGYLMGVAGPKQYKELRHYDVIWYRDAYDMALLQSQGLYFPGARLQHIFGLSPDIGGVGKMEKSYVFASVRRGPEIMDEEEEIAPETPYSCPRDAADIVVVCSAEHAHMCTYLNIQANIEGKRFTLVLLGGLWAHWLQHKSLFIEASAEDDGLSAISQLACTFHFEEGVGSAIRLIHGASRLLYVHDPSKSVPAEIWPFIAAGNAGASVQILSMDPRVIRVVEEYSASWSDSYLRESVLRGIARLHGFAPRSGRVEIDPSLLGGVILTHPLSFKPMFHNVTISQDGRACFKQNGITGMCILWDLDTWSLSWNYTSRNVSMMSANPSICGAAMQPYAHENECPLIVPYGGRQDLLEIIFEVDIQGPVFSDPSDPLEWRIFVPAEASLECVQSATFMSLNQGNIVLHV